MLYAIGADHQVEAVDSSSNYPEGVPTTDLAAFTPNAEAIAKYEPDLVVLSDDMNGIVGALADLKVPTLRLGAAQTLDDTYAQLDTLGKATGHADEADGVVADIQDRIKKAVDSVPADAKGEKVYHELDPTYYSAASSTFIGSICPMFGLQNIADGAPDAGAATRSCRRSTSSAGPRPHRAGRHRLLRPSAEALARVPPSTPCQP